MVEVTYDNSPTNVLRIPPGAVEIALHLLAELPTNGTSAAELKLRGHITSAYDVVSDLRTLLGGMGLSIAKKRYRVTTLVGDDIPVTSDLIDFRVSANAAVNAERDGNPSEFDTVELVALETQMSLPLHLWRVESVTQRETILALHGEDWALYGRLRLAHARVLVALAERFGTSPAVEKAGDALNRLRTEQVAERDHKQLTKRMRLVEARLATEQSAHLNNEVEVFLAAPMATASAYDPIRELTLKVANALCDHCGVGEVYCAATTITDRGVFEEPSTALQKNMVPFRAARAFAMLLPEPVPSSVFVEAGMALAFGLPSVYFVKRREDLPWMLRDVSGAAVPRLGCARIVEYRDDADLLRKIAVNGRQLFPPGSPKTAT